MKPSRPLYLPVFPDDSLSSLVLTQGLRPIADSTDSVQCAHEAFEDIRYHFSRNTSPLQVPHDAKRMSTVLDVAVTQHVVVLPAIRLKHDWWYCAGLVVGAKQFFQIVTQRRAPMLG